MQLLASFGQQKGDRDSEYARGGTESLLQRSLASGQHEHAGKKKERSQDGASLERLLEVNLSLFVFRVFLFGARRLGNHLFLLENRFFVLFRFALRMTPAL